MLKLKDCPRCKKGNVIFDRDQYGWYEYCIQCGYLRDLGRTTELVQQQTGGVKKGEKERRGEEAKLWVKGSSWRWMTEFTYC